MIKLDVDDLMEWLQELVADDNITRGCADKVIYLLGSYFGERFQRLEEEKE